MFKRFVKEDHVSSYSRVKSSVQRNIRLNIIAEYPLLSQNNEFLAEVLLPKKEAMFVAKVGLTHITIVLHAEKKASHNETENNNMCVSEKSVETVENTNDTTTTSSSTNMMVPLFFQYRNGPFLPTLRLLHQYPSLLPTVRADKGAIPYVLAGANVMSPGLTSTGGDLTAFEIQVSMPVAILAEGKELAMAVGWMKMSTAEIKEQNKGVAIEMGHFLGDDLWRLENFG